MFSKGVAVSAVSLGLTLFSTVTLADGINVAHVVVEGPENRVYEFHQNLKALVSAMQVEGDLGVAGVDCSNPPPGSKSCDELKIRPQEEDATVKVEYVIYREHLSAFGLAWDKLQDRAFASVSMKFDMDVGGTPDCLVPTFAKQPCTNAPACPNTTPRRCDKASGPPCTSCGIP